MAFVAFGLRAAPARADDAPVTVDLSGGVPDRSLPFGQAFMVKVPVKPVSTQAYGVFFEYSHKIWGIGKNPGRCAEVAKGITVTPEALKQYKPGITTLGKLFASTDLSEAPSLALVPWQRPATTGSDQAPVNEALLKVPPGDFFVPGARYCFVAFEAGNLEESVLPELQGLGQRVADCVAVTQAPDLAAAKRCGDEAVAVLDKKLGAGLLERKKHRRIEDWLGAVANFFEKKRESEQALTEAIEHGGVLGPNALAPLPANEKPLDLWSKIDVSVLAQPTLPEKAQVQFTDALVAALVEHGKFTLVASERGKTKASTPDKSKTSTEKSKAAAPDKYVDADGNELLALRLDGTTVRALVRKAQSPSPVDVAVDVKLSELPALGATTFGDWVALAHGALPRSDGSSVSFRELLATVRSLNVSNVASQSALLQDVGARLKELKAATNFTSIPRAPFSATLAAHWWQTVTEEPARADLNRLADTLPLVGDLLSGLTPEAMKATVELGQTATILSIDASAALTQDTWFANYVVPTVGYTLVAHQNLPTTGVQIYLFPNVANQPMWTNGSDDWGRAFSLQLAAALGAQAFGPENRYSGWKSLPPLLVGLGVNVIPWTTISTGGMIYEVKNSTLPQEKAALRGAWYVDFAVQANVPDIIKLLIQPAGGKKE